MEISGFLTTFAVDMNDAERLIRLAVDAGLGTPEGITPVAAAASSRRYYRLTMPGASTVIGAIGMNSRENRAFIHIARCMAAEGIPAPRVLAVEDGDGAYIVSDLGDRSMMDAVSASAASGQWEGTEGFEALAACMDALPGLQYGVASRLDTAMCYPRQAMDRRSVMWDLNQFKYCFLKAAGVETDEDALEADFEKFASIIERQSGGPFRAFMHRDCQSRNVMLTPDGRPQWIDFQGGRMGPVAYDVASMVWHPRAAIPDNIRQRLVGLYIDALGRRIGRRVGREEFEEVLRPVLVLRFLQVLGAYGLRGLTEGKATFVTPIPAAVAELERMVPWMRSEGLTALAGVASELKHLPVVCEASESRSGLVVTVGSFSYKRGLPHDYSGNGGGFVFDCRYCHNPGRYPEYRTLTGRDTAVKLFLEERGEMPRLASDALKMVLPAVERYRQRGFTHLSVWFGCTGGRHRSVYGAESVARALAGAGVKVHLVHREQGIDEWLCPDAL